MKYQIKKASENCIDTLYYHDMFGSPTCWKIAADVNKELIKLGSKNTKLNSL